MKSASHGEIPSKRIRELDGLRGLAILLVLIWHYLACQLQPAKGTALAYLSSALHLTWSGVDLFFVLSGFLIAGILFENKAAGNFFSVFYRRRICRIFPLYYTVLAGYFAARAALGEHAHFGWLFGNPLPLWRFATFTQNILVAKAGFTGGWLGVTWSLAVEEQFYLFLPLLIWVLPPRTIPVVLVALIAAAVALRAFLPGFVSFVGMPWRADSLLMGALLAYAVRRRDFADAVASKRWLLRATLGVLLIGNALLCTSAMANWSETGGAFVHFWLALFYSALLLLALVDTGGWLGRVLRNRALVWLGSVSYGVYMFHQIVLGFLHGTVGHAAPVLRDSRDALMTVAALLATLLLAALSYYGMERRIVHWGHHFRYQTAPRQGEAFEASQAVAESSS